MKIYFTYICTSFLTIWLYVTQERFWRIPGRLNPDDLRGRAAALAPPTEGEVGKKSNKRRDALKALIKNKRQEQKEKASDKITKKRLDQISSQIITFWGQL